MRTVIVSNETLSKKAAAEAAQHGESVISYPDDYPLRTLALCARLTAVPSR